MTTKLKLTPEAMSAYRTTVQRRGEYERRVRTQRRERAWQVAQQAAKLLKEEFDVERVRIFGSLAHGQWFSKTSDVDLAAWGLKNENYFIAVARLQDISPEFKVDLVAMESCPLGLRGTIAKEGKLL